MCLFYEKTLLFYRVRSSAPEALNAVASLLSQKKTQLYVGACERSEYRTHQLLESRYSLLVSSTSQQPYLLWVRMSAANVERTHILIEWGESGANSPTPLQRVKRAEDEFPVYGTLNPFCLVFLGLTSTFFPKKEDPTPYPLVWFPSYLLFGFPATSCLVSQPP